MTLNNSRLQKIELALTPKQAVLAYRIEARKLFKTADEEARWLCNPQNMAKVHKRWENVDAEIKRAMKGQAQQDIQRAIRQSRRDICLLLGLHQTVNFWVQEDEAHYNMLNAYLMKQVNTFLNEKSVSDDFIQAIQYLEKVPYPLDRETAQIARGIIDHAVHDLCITDNQVADWLRGSENKSKAYKRFLEAVQDLVKEGKVQGGKLVNLSPASIIGFYSAPLIDGEWLDQALAEMAEWGALLEQKGYEFKQADDDHPLAMNLFYSADAEWDGKDVPQALSRPELGSIQDEVRRNWQLYPGESKIIDGRPYIRLTEYLQWDKRYNNGEFEIEDGVLTTSWNRWVESHHGDALLAGIPVDKLDYWFDKTSFTVCDTVSDAMVKQEERKAQIASMRKWIVNQYETAGEYEMDRHCYGMARRILPMDNEPFKTKISTWKNSITTFLKTHYITLGAIQWIENHYFDGYPLLYGEFSTKLQLRLQHLEGLVGFYNDHMRQWLAWRASSIEEVSHEALRAEAALGVSTMADSMVMKTKAKVLDEMGYEDQARDLYTKMMD